MEKDKEVLLINLLMYYVSELDNLTYFYLLSRRGVYENDNFEDYDSPNISEETNKRKREEIQTFAQNEINNGSPYLQNLLITKLCTIIESFIDDVALHLIKYDEKILELESFRKLRGPLIEFVQLTRQDQAEFLLEVLKQEIKANLKTGIGKYEVVLNSLGYGGSVNELVRYNLLELISMRNVIIHKNGKVDQRLLVNCPKVKYKLGEAVCITFDDLIRYLVTTNWYMNEVGDRLSTEEKNKEIFKNAKIDIEKEMSLI